MVGGVAGYGFLVDVVEVNGGVLVVFCHPPDHRFPERERESENGFNEMQRKEGRSSDLLRES